MTAAHRLKGLGWFAGCTAIVLGFYLVSLQVASERKKLEGLNGDIAVASRDIRALETEFDTRANLAQLERWNGDTLALSAPQASQFLRDEAQLASIDARQPMLLHGGEVKTAALVVPSLSVPVAPSAPANGPAARAPVDDVAQARSAAPEPVEVAAVAAPTNVAFVPDRERPRARAAALLRGKPEVAMLDRKLLSDSTLGDLLSRARTERSRLR